MNSLFLSKSIRIVCMLIVIFVMCQSKGYSQPIPAQNHVVSLETAEHYILNFKNNPTIDTTKASFFWKEIFSKILAQPKCVGIRIYYAKLDNGSPTLVMVGVDANGKDLEDGVIGEEIRPCPPWCDSNSSLYK
jgi:hypothetical protein